MSFYAYLYKAALYMGKWLLLSILVGVLAGSASAIFLIMLDYATELRENNLWLIATLPVAGAIIGLYYHYYGEKIVKGNNLLLDAYNHPKQNIPFYLAPAILFSTVLTHLAGGSAGREGTAVQMGGAVAYPLVKWFKLNESSRRCLIIMGISAGFSSVFGTPLAGTIFALEVLAVGVIRLEYVLPSLFAAIAAHYFAMLWPIHHTHYSIDFVPDLTVSTVGLSIVSGVVFGLAAYTYIKFAHFFSDSFKKYVKYPPIRPVFGGVILAVVFYVTGTRYAGLGVPVIQSAFHQIVPWYDSAAKIIFTTFTLGAGFKGGEVTPLFFIGATLGNTLSQTIDLPMALLAGMGFVAVFAGATNTPVACMVMGIELFGANGAVYMAIACVVAYLFSGLGSIYTSQGVDTHKHTNFL